VKGAIVEGLLREFEAEGSVKMEIKHAKDGTVTKISGGKALYSKDRGSIVMSGGAVAVQRGRKITAKNVVFYPTTSKIEAKGNPKITFDVE
jgi:lipopolysaccharide assembly outer membrane protein LptD (OstA)